MINKYGADAVRLFILSDSPPERDVQWSDAGVEGANKFLQKVWNLNYLILNNNLNAENLSEEKRFTTEVDNFVKKLI